MLNSIVGELIGVSTAVAGRGISEAGILDKWVPTSVAGLEEDSAIMGVEAIAGSWLAG